MPFHYGWIIVATGTLIVIACLGFGRFALGMLLPSMGASLKMDYAHMGYVSTGNFVGYLSAVVLSALLTERLGARRLIVTGLALVSVSMMGVALTRSFWQVLVLYVITGFGSGAANVPIMALVSHWFGRRLRGRAAGFMVIGSGIAIIISGQLIPAVDARVGAEGWRWSWLVLGIASLAITAVALALLRDHPDDLGLLPLAADTAPQPGAATPAGPSHSRHVIAHLGAIYFLFGYTYVIYATFIVTTLVQGRGFSEAAAGRFWTWVGAFSLLSGPVFGTLSDRLGRKTGLMVVFAIQAVAYVLAALHLPIASIYLSVFLFGIVAWSIPTIMAAAVGDYLGPAHAAAAFGTITLFFGVGQIIGPAIAGVVADHTGGFGASYMMAAAMAAAAVILSGALRRPGN